MQRYFPDYQNQPGCHQPGFGAFAQRPYLAGAQNTFFKCRWHATHDYRHVEPQAECLVDDRLQLCADFLIRRAASQLDRWDECCAQGGNALHTPGLLCTVRLG